LNDKRYNAIQLNKHIVLAGSTYPSKDNTICYMPLIKFIGGMAIIDSIEENEKSMYCGVASRLNKIITL